MNEEQIRQLIKEELESFVNERTSHERLISDRTIFNKSIQINDGLKLYVGGVNGFKIGTSADEKLAFYGTTPVDQPDTIADPSGGAVIDSEARTIIASIIDRLQELGLIA